MEHIISCGAATDVGKVRTHNEDRFRSEPGLGLFVVADGMGGHQGGEIASAIAVDMIVEGIRSGQSLSDMITESHYAIIRAGQEGNGPAGMGTTIVALKIADYKYEIAWVGDCRGYLWDGGSLRQLTKDHSYVQYLVDQGIISAEEAVHSAHQNFVMQALGSTEIDDLCVDKIGDVIYLGEQILLCSDGLVKELSDKDIADILSLDLNEQEKVDHLIQTAVNNGGKDNITVVLVGADDGAPARALKGANRQKFFEKLITWIKRIPGYFK